jgi:hypothetical protein
MTKTQECVPREDLGADKMTGRARAYSVEPMESDLATLKGKPQQFVEVPDIDGGDTDKEYACAEYAKQINHYLKTREVLLIYLMFKNELSLSFVLIIYFVFNV